VFYVFYVLVFSRLHNNFCSRYIDDSVIALNVIF